MPIRIIAGIAMTLLGAAPALASRGTPIPEASSMTLFALGVLGLVVGRRLATNRSDRDE